MAAAALVTENFKFVSLFFKSKDVMMFNGLIALGTVAGQTAYNVFAFDCPCSPGRNYLYGLAAIGVPALVFFLVGIMFNRSTWEMVSECRLRRCRKLSGAAFFALIGSIFGRAVVAPITWVVISLLQGQAYACALSEFVESSATDGIPAREREALLAKLPCYDAPENMLKVKVETQRQLKYESQLLGWLLVAGMSVAVFLMLCTKRCSSPLGYLQEDYWARYHANEKSLYERTADLHSRLMAADNISSLFGFAALDKAEREQLSAIQSARTVDNTDWRRVTGVYLYREKDGLPLYSRIHKWATYSKEDNTDDMEKELDML